MICNNSAIVETALAGSRVWEPAELPRADQWVEQNIVLNSDYEAAGGAYQIDTMPYWREPLLMLDRRGVETITIMASTQVGKTLFLQAALLSRARLDAAPSMIALPDWVEARKFRDRIYGNAATSSMEVQEMIPPPRLWNMLEIDLGTMLAHIAWSGSSQRLRGKPCKYVFCSEVDVYDFGNKAGDPINAASQRTKQFADSKVVCESTPVGDSSRIASLYDDSDARQWYCPCPHCGRYQPLRFFTLRHGQYKGRGGIAGYKPSDDPDTAREAAHYICMDGCRIENHDKNWMVVNGVWVPKGCKIEERRDAALIAKLKRQAKGGDGAALVEPPPIVGQPKRSTRDVGYHLWSVFNPQISFGDLSARYISLRRKGQLADFYQNELGLRFRVPTKVPHWRRLGRRLAGNHKRGHVPPPVWFLTAGCDVQADEVFWIVRGWGPWRTSWLIDFGRCRRSVDTDAAGRPYAVINSDLAALDGTVIGRAFPMQGGDNPWGRSQLMPTLTGVDSNYRPLDVHEFVRFKDPDEVRCIRGDDAVGGVAKFRPQLVERNTRTGEPYEGGMIQWGIYVSGYKDDLAPRLLGTPHEIGSFHLLPGMDQTPLGRLYLKQMVNEEKLEQPNGKKAWKLRSNYLRKDFRDCEIYAAALADMVVGDIGWEESAWLEYLAARLAGDDQQTNRGDQSDYSAR